MRNPLIEYYIGKSGGSSKGTYSCNGRSYTIEIYRQRGKPSIVGTADFDQYNCRGSRDSPVDMGCHFDAWRNLGVAVGTHDYQVVMAEGFGGSSGNASISVSDANWYTHWTNGGSVNFECTGSGTNPTPNPTGTPTPTGTTGPTETPTSVPTATPVPTVKPTPPPSINPGNGDGLLGEYYNDTNFSNLVLSRIDSVLDMNWGGGSPASSIPENNLPPGGQEKSKHG